MSALAQALVAAGYDVSGSDRYLDRGIELEVLAKLARCGVRLVPQDGSGVVPGCEAVVVSTAIESNNPDIETARRQGIPIVHRATMLNRLIGGHYSIAVTGTSGKSTVTGMLGWTLAQTGKDPTVVLGATVMEWEDEQHLGNMRPGRRDFWVFEADESDRSLMQFEPDWAVITNVSRDHFSAEEAYQLFSAFRQRVRKGSVGVLDDQSLLARLSPVVHEEGSRFSYGGVEFRVKLPGRHNAENALWVVRMCEKLGIDLTVVSRALAQFRGIRRRLERIGVARGVLVVDDFAHNPSKIRATWESLAPYHPRIFAIWRPHGYGPLAGMLEELARTFSTIIRPADRLYLLPVYDAGGTANRTVSHHLLAEHPLLKGLLVRAVEAPDTAAAEVVAAARAGDAIITMGARDPFLPTLARTILRDLCGGSPTLQESSKAKEEIRPVSQE